MESNYYMTAYIIPSLYISAVLSLFKLCYAEIFTEIKKLLVSLFLICIINQRELTSSVLQSFVAFGLGVQNWKFLDISLFNAIRDTVRA